MPDDLSQLLRGLSPEDMQQFLGLGSIGEKQDMLAQALRGVNAPRQHHSFLGGLLPGVAAGVGGYEQQKLLGQETQGRSAYAQALARALGGGAPNDFAGGGSPSLMNAGAVGGAAGGGAPQPGGFVGPPAPAPDAGAAEEMLSGSAFAPRGGQQPQSPRARMLAMLLQNQAPNPLDVEGTYGGR